MKSGQQDDGPRRAKRQRIGPAVRELRRRRGWSQADLGSRAGLSPTQLSRLERGASDPSYRTLCVLADVLEVDIRYFTSIHQLDTELDHNLAAYFLDLGIPREHWDDYFSLSLEARGALADALRWMTGADTGLPVREHTLKQELLSRGVRASLPQISRALAEFGLDPVEFGRAMVQQEEFPGERMEINDRLPNAAIPVLGGIDPVEGFRSCYVHAEMTVPLVRWWAQAMHSAVKENAEQYPARSIYPLGRIEHYMESGQWDAGATIALGDVRRQIASLIDALRLYPNYRIGLIDTELPFNLLIKGHKQTCLFVRPQAHAISIDQTRVALKFTRPDLVACFRAYFEELWESIPAQWKDAESVAAWLENRLTAIPA